MIKHYDRYVDYIPSEKSKKGQDIRFRVPIEEGQEVTEELLHAKWLEWKAKYIFNDQEE